MTTKKIKRILVFLILFFTMATPLFSADGTVQAERNYPAIAMFLAVVTMTLIITYWAAKRTKTRSDFYAAGESFSGFQNGLAIAGDFMSAATFLGASAIVFSIGYDAIIFTTGATLGWVVILFLIAERLRNLGRYTFADVTAYRLQRTPIRILSAVGALTVAVPYLLAQMVGAGELIQALFGLPYNYAVILVGLLMTLYVTMGGMLATTWVQIIKAGLLLIGGTVLAIGVLIKFGFNIELLAAQAVEIHKSGASIMAPGKYSKDTISVISLALAYLCGTAGLPHILMRFFTVPDAKQARRSVVYALSFIAFFMALIFPIGLGGIVLICQDPGFFDAAGQLRGGGNMVSIHLAGIIGGNIFLGFISAVAFATILAVVSGLTLSAASAVSHDLYASVFKHGEATEKGELRASKITTIFIGIITTFLGILFKGQNVAVLAVIPLVIAASVNFPVLILSMFWRGLTTRGAIAGGTVGLIVSVVMIVLGPMVWVNALGNPKPIVPYAYPTLFPLLLSFMITWIVSILDKSKGARREREAFDQQLITSEIGAYNFPQRRTLSRNNYSGLGL